MQVACLQGGLSHVFSMLVSICSDVLHLSQQARRELGPHPILGYERGLLLLLDLQGRRLCGSHASSCLLQLLAGGFRGYPGDTSQRMVSTVCCCPSRLKLMAGPCVHGKG